MPLSKDAGTGCTEDTPTNGLKSMSEDRLSLRTEDAGAMVGNVCGLDERSEVGNSGFAADVLA